MFDFSIIDRLPDDLEDLAKIHLALTRVIIARQRGVEPERAMVMFLKRHGIDAVSMSVKDLDRVRRYVHKYLVKLAKSTSEYKFELNDHFYIPDIEALAMSAVERANVSIDRDYVEVWWSEEHERGEEVGITVTAEPSLKKIEIRATFTVTSQNANLPASKNYRVVELDELPEEVRKRIMDELGDELSKCDIYGGVCVIVPKKKGEAFRAPPFVVWVDDQAYHPLCCGDVWEVEAEMVDTGEAEVDEEELVKNLAGELVRVGYRCTVDRILHQRIDDFAEAYGWIAHVDCVKSIEWNGPEAEIEATKEFYALLRTFHLV